MQNALQNPHYKKIWEKVIMNDNPKAKTLEEALQYASSRIDCLISLNGKIYNFHDDCIDFDARKNIVRHISYYEAKAYEEPKYHVIDEDECVVDAKCQKCDSTNITINDVVYKAKTTRHKNFQILGRPITLFDVLDLLQKNTKNDTFALMTNCIVLCSIDATRNIYNDTFPYFIKKICDINSESVLLEKQTPETWEAISNLI